MTVTAWFIWWTLTRIFVTDLDCAKNLIGNVRSMSLGKSHYKKPQYLLQMVQPHPYFLELKYFTVLHCDGCAKPSCAFMFTWTQCSYLLQHFKCMLIQICGNASVFTFIMFPRLLRSCLTDNVFYLLYKEEMIDELNFIWFLWVFFHWEFRQHLLCIFNIFVHSDSAAISPWWVNALIIAAKDPSFPDNHSYLLRLR